MLSGNSFSFWLTLLKILRKQKLMSLVIIGLAYWGYSRYSSGQSVLPSFDGTFSEIRNLFSGGQQNQPTDYSVEDPENFLLQGSRQGVSEQLLYRKAYVVSYNKDTRQPNWVAWCLTKDHADGDVPRQQQFIEDTDVPYPRPTLEDYRRSGYDRGHMCPAGDNKWDKQAMYESFYLTNMCPQNPSLNSGLWNRFEQDCRMWAKKYGEIYIVCGPIFLRQKHKTIGGNRIIVPEAFFKVVLCMKGEPKGFGIICRNTDGQKKKDLYYNTIDEVERITGIDFFPSLPDDIESQVESTVDENLWK